jgi:hypothetical protein
MGAISASHFALHRGCSADGAVIMRYAMGIYALVVGTAAMQTAPVTRVQFLTPMALPELVQVGELPSSVAGRMAYAMDFGTLGFYAAFATASDGRYGWSTERHDMADARTEALAWCNDGGDGCRVIAEIWPAGDRRVDGVVTLSHWAVVHGAPDQLPVGRDVWVALGSDGSWHVARNDIMGDAKVRRDCVARVARSVAEFDLPISGCRVYLGRRVAE